MQTQNLSRAAQVQEVREPVSRPVAAAGAETRVSQDAIRERACQIYQARVKAGQPGDELSDWLEAERELKGKAKPAVSRRAN
jgi:hypothetical protein